MQLASVRVLHMGPFVDLAFGFANRDESSRRMTCIVGGAGTGKTSLVAALSCTRPGHAVVVPRLGSVRSPKGPLTVADWMVGQDDPARPHPLRVVTPGGALPGEDEDRILERRREQTIYERKALEGGGFVFVALPSCRWFSRSPLLLSAPERTIGRYDVRAAFSADDATRADLSRETKQLLSYAVIRAALAGKAGHSATEARLEQALRQALSELLGLLGFAFVGADPATLEPVFQSPSGALLPFDDLPTGARHLAAFAALPLRAVHGAYPDGDPRAAEAVVAIDDVELHQDIGVQSALVPALKRALPRVQWILTTSSAATASACDPDEVIALRRLQANGGIELYTGLRAVVH
jgi:hypothetical protein